MKILKLRESFEICGLKTRTNNADEMSGRGAIANLWGEFLKFNASGSGAAKSGIYAAYYDYENGAQGEYSVLIGTCSKEQHHKESHDEACKSINQCRKNEITRFLILRTSLRELANTGLKFGIFLKVRSFKEPLKWTLKSTRKIKFKFTYR